MFVGINGLFHAEFPPYFVGEFMAGVFFDGFFRGGGDGLHMEEPRLVRIRCLILRVIHGQVLRRTETGAWS